MIMVVAESMWSIVIAGLSFLVAFAALIKSWLTEKEANRIGRESNQIAERSEAKADEANKISHDLKLVAQHANDIAEHALKLQENQANVQLVVRPTMQRTAGNYQAEHFRPVIEIINLSAFPVRIISVAWKCAGSNGQHVRANIVGLSVSKMVLPVEIESRRRLLVYCHWFSENQYQEFLAIEAAIVQTECGEAIEGVTEQWREYAAKAREKGKIHWKDGA